MADLSTSISDLLGWYNELARLLGDVLSYYSALSNFFEDCSGLNELSPRYFDKFDVYNFKNTFGCFLFEGISIDFDLFNTVDFSEE